MQFKDKYNIAPEFKELFSFKNKKEEIEHEAAMIHAKILSQLCRKNIGLEIIKKSLKKPKKIIDDFLCGDKLFSLEDLAKIQKACGIKFEINAEYN